jgi:hypothetical protein
VSSNHPKVPSRHILDLIPPRVPGPELPPLSLALSLWTCLYLPPPFCLALFFSFFNAAFLRPRNGAKAYSCAAADYNHAQEGKDDNDDDNDYAWGEEGHCRNHPGLDD